MGGSMCICVCLSCSVCEEVAHCGHSHMRLPITGKMQNQVICNTNSMCVGVVECHWLYDMTHRHPTLAKLVVVVACVEVNFV